MTKSKKEKGTTSPEPNEIALSLRRKQRVLHEAELRRIKQGIRRAGRALSSQKGYNDSRA